MLHSSTFPRLHRQNNRYILYDIVVIIFLYTYISCCEPIFILVETCTIVSTTVFYYNSTVGNVFTISILYTKITVRKEAFHAIT